MSRLSAELPVAQGVAVIRTLGEHADSLRASGDPRTRSELMADTLVTWVLGIEQPSALPVTSHVVVADDVLFGHAEDAAHLDGTGPIPAELARELVTTAAARRRTAGGPDRRRVTATPSRSPRPVATCTDRAPRRCRGARTERSTSTSPSSRSPGQPTTASISTSTSQRGSSSPATTTKVLAGRTSPKISPCTAPTASARSARTTY